MASKQQQAFKMCVHPCPRYLTGGDTHTLCVACLGEEHAQSALESCEHCEVFPLRTFRSRLAFYREDAQARVPQGAGPAAAEAQRRLRSWGSQMNLSAEVEMGAALSLPSPDRFSASYQGWEAPAAVSSAPIEAHTLQLSDSEELCQCKRYWGFATSVSCLWGAVWGCDESGWKIKYWLASKKGRRSFKRQTWWTLFTFSCTEMPGITIFSWSPHRGVLTERTRSRIQAAEMSFLRRMAGRSLRDRVRSSVTREELRVEPLLLHIKRGQLRWLGHLFRMPPERLHGKVFRARPTGRRPRGRPRTRWRDYVSRLAWERLGVPPEELEEVTREREVWASLLRLLPPRPGPG